MKTLIVGTGVIGTIFGWALAEAGIDVTHYIRSGEKKTYRHGLDLDLLDERKGHPGKNLAHYDIHCVEEVAPEGGYELIIVSVNAHQLTELIHTLLPGVKKDAIFLLMTSNWEGISGFDVLLPRERYLLGYVEGGGTVRDGVYWTNLSAEIQLGALEGQNIEKLAQVKALFEKVDIKPDIQPNVLSRMWVHNASTADPGTGTSH